MAERNKSPGYPAIDLKMAVARLRTVWDLTRDGTVASRKKVFDAWGYESLTGGGATTWAALGYYGLAESSGSGEERQMLITLRGADIMTDRMTSSSGRAALRESALQPKYFRMVYERFPDPNTTDSTIAVFLHEEGFSAGGIVEFMRSYRRTMDFAGLGSGFVPSPNMERLLEMQASSQKPQGSLPTPQAFIERNKVTTVARYPLKFPYRYRGTLMELSIDLPTPLKRSEWETISNIMTTVLDQVLDED